MRARTAVLLASSFGMIGLTLLVTVPRPTASGAKEPTRVTGWFVAGLLPVDDDLHDTTRPDAIVIRNEGPGRIESVGFYLSRGADEDGDGLGLFFDTTYPSTGRPPGPETTEPGFAGAARMRVTSKSTTLTGYRGSGLFVWYPGTLEGSEGDGAVQLVRLACDHFDPGEVLVVGIDVDGYEDFGVLDPSAAPLPSGQRIAMGQCMVRDEGQVYFDVLSADTNDLPVAEEALRFGEFKARSVR